MRTIDFKLFELINRFAGKWPLLDTVMVATAKYGPLLFIIALLYFWFKKGKDGQEVAILAITSLMVALIINQLIGHIYFRPRPFALHQVNLLLSKSADPSFPSDHATFSFAVAVVIWLWDRRIGIPLIILGFLVAFSRIFVGTHYPLDVIGGAIIGSITALIVWRLRQKLEPIVGFIISVAQKIRLA